MPTAAAASAASARHEQQRAEQQEELLGQTPARPAMPRPRRRAHFAMHDRAATAAAGSSPRVLSSRDGDVQRLEQQCDGERRQKCRAPAARRGATRTAKRPRTRSGSACRQRTRRASAARRAARRDRQRRRVLVCANRVGLGPKSCSCRTRAERGRRSRASPPMTIRAAGKKQTKSPPTGLPWRLTGPRCAAKCAASATARPSRIRNAAGQRRLHKHWSTSRRWFARGFYRTWRSASGARSAACIVNLEAGSVGLAGIE